MAKILVVGAGLAGAVHARELAENGHTVHVIEKRDHIAGNCFDYVSEQGVRIHKYGPHLFHTSNKRVVEWIQRYAEWTPYQHRVVVKLADGSYVPLPVNRDTVSAVFHCELKTEEDVQRKLDEVRVPIETVVSAEDFLYNNIGETLTNLFYRPYTLKMWGYDLSEMDSSVVRRIKIRTDTNDLYFPDDDFQALPTEGYTAFIGNVLNHPRISIEQGRAFCKVMLGYYDYCFNSMPIDEFFDFKFGALPYRSLRFHVEAVPVARAQRHATINYSDTGPYTRETWWHNLPCHLIKDSGHVIRTVEEPCDYLENDFERYYPVKTHDGRYDLVYQKYQSLATSLSPNVEFIGRCGTYRYLDMHQVINQSLINARKFCDQHSVV